MEKKGILSLSFSGGREEAYVCLFEYFIKKKRWFVKLLKPLHELDDSKEHVFSSLFNEYSINLFIVDRPLTGPLCWNCKLTCPGENRCPVNEVTTIRKFIDQKLLVDEELYTNSPKDYEHRRIMKEDSLDGHNLKIDEAVILSRSLKRKMRKGFSPHINRTIDPIIWDRYSDYLHSFYKNSIDSMTRVNLTQFGLLQYLKKGIPTKVELAESLPQIIIIELLLGKIITRNDLYQLNQQSTQIKARSRILKKIESKYQIFLYDQDASTLVHSTSAFHTFLLALSGQKKWNNQVHASFPEIENTFIFPVFN